MNELVFAVTVKVEKFMTAKPRTFSARESGLFLLPSQMTQAVLPLVGTGSVVSSVDSVSWLLLF